MNEEGIGDDDGPTAKYIDDEIEGIDSSRVNLRSSRDLIDPDEEFTRVLTTENPHGSKNLVMYSNREKQFLPLINIEQFSVHYFYEGNLIPIDSEEAKSYIQREKLFGIRMRPTALLDVYQVKKKELMGAKQSDEISSGSQQPEDEDEQRSVSNERTEQNEQIDIDDLMLVPRVASLSLTPKPKKVLNRFNYCEQGIQTYSPPKKDATIITDAIPHKKFVGLANQRVIYQEYAVDFDKQQKDKDKRKQKAKYGLGKGTTEKKVAKMDRLKPELISKRRHVQILKAIERVLNQNRYHELIYNFKYFEDTADVLRDPMGALFPLWKFPPSFADRSVTALTWNPAYSDMLVIGYGLYDRAERIQGTIALLTLNNSHPDTLIVTESTVLSIDCLPSKPYLVCVGLMDGDVIVYDVSVPSGKTVFTNPSYMCKHLGCVWQVRWCASSGNHHPRFCSVGGDGKVLRWTCIKGELRPILLLNLVSTNKPTRLDDGTLLTLPDPAIVLDFHRNRKDVFLVGTEDGKIYKASVNDPGMIDASFDAHDFAVYAVQWSPFHPHVFLSCSADGTVKIWHEKLAECLMRFDLCTSLQDISWSPHTSTTFAAVGADGKIYIFDIHSNKLEPICEQHLASESGKACTKIAFNRIHPILLAGDKTGWTMCLKLSPNLRKKAKIRKGIELPQDYEPELDKLIQELTRTMASNARNDILLLLAQIGDHED